MARTLPVAAALLFAAWPSAQALRLPAPDTKKASGALQLRKGLATDSVKKGSGFNFVNLTEVLTAVRESLPGKTFGKKPTLVNVGASYKDEDPIYSMTLSQNFDPDYVVLGYDCSHGKILAQKRPDVTFRSMCVTGPTILVDMATMQVPERFAMLKTDIDSLDAPVLDAILQTYKPYVVYSEIMWDFPPPIKFSLVKAGDNGFDGRHGGCFGMSLEMAAQILHRNGYVLIEAAHANFMAVHQDVAHLFADRPTDTWFWYQTVKSSLYHTHWLGAGMIHAKNSTPLSFLSENVGLFGGGMESGQFSMDATMAKVAQRVKEGCTMSNGEKYVLAVGDRCCAPEWNPGEGCVCEFEAKDFGVGLRTE